MSGFINKDELESSMDNLKYREVVIRFHNQNYHIEAYSKKYVIGIFNKKEYKIDSWIEVEGVSDDDAFNKLMNQPLFDGFALKDIINDIEWLEG